MVVQPAGSAPTGLPWMPLAVLLAGFALIGSGATYAQGMIARASRVERLVARRTEELVAANRKLGESEASLTAIIMSVTEGLAVFTDEGRVVLWNNALSAITGLTASETAGRHIDDLIQMKVADFENPEALGVLRDTLLNQIEASGPVDLIMGRPERRELLVRVFRIELGPGQVLPGMVVSDVTRQRDLDRRKDTFVSVASHELRTPITTIVGFTELLLHRDPAPENRRAWLQMIYHASLRMTAIIDELLEVSRIHAGKLDLKRERFSIAPIAEKVVSNLKAVTNRHQFTVVIPADVPAVWGDQNKMEQVLTNLVDNAVKYSPDGGRVVVLAQHDQERRRVVMSVSDDGIGIGPKDMPDLFTSFHRIRRPETMTVKGTGLGLYITKSLVELMQGEIWLESNPGKGSTFHFTLPTI